MALYTCDSILNPKRQEDLEKSVQDTEGVGSRSFVHASGVPWLCLKRYLSNCFCNGRRLVDFFRPKLFAGDNGCYFHHCLLKWYEMDVFSIFSVIRFPQDAPSSKIVFGIFVEGSEATLRWCVLKGTGFNP